MIIYKPKGCDLEESVLANHECDKVELCRLTENRIDQWTLNIKTLIEKFGTPAFINHNIAFYINSSRQKDIDTGRVVRVNKDWVLLVEGKSKYVPESIAGTCKSIFESNININSFSMNWLVTRAHFYGDENAGILVNKNGDYSILFAEEHPAVWKINGKAIFVDGFGYSFKRSVKDAKKIVDAEYSSKVYSHFY